MRLLAPQHKTTTNAWKTNSIIWTTATIMIYISIETFRHEEDDVYQNDDGDQYDEIMLIMTSYLLDELCARNLFIKLILKVKSPLYLLYFVCLWTQMYTFTCE